MKKLYVILGIVLVLTGCSQTPSADPPKTEGYEFEVNGITIAMHAGTAPILAELGDHLAYFEAESCAYQGMEKTYTYNGFELYTYELDGTDYVASIVFIDDSVATKEGIYLYSSLEEVLSAYGDTYTKTLNLYTYELGETKLSFLIENDHVSSIEYIAVIE